jgi:hypothetical protein
VTVHLTGGQCLDLIGFGPLFERGALRTGRRGRPRRNPAVVIADNAYSAAWLLDGLRGKRIALIVPSRSDSGRVAEAAQPRPDRGELDEGEIMQIELVVAGRDPRQAPPDHHQRLSDQPLASGFMERNPRPSRRARRARWSAEAGRSPP